MTTEAEKSHSLLSALQRPRNAVGPGYCELEGQGLRRADV